MAAKNVHNATNRTENTSNHQFQVSTNPSVGQSLHFASNNEFVDSKPQTSSLKIIEIKKIPLDNGDHRTTLAKGCTCQRILRMNFRSITIVPKSSVKFMPDKKYLVIFKFRTGKPFIKYIEKPTMNPYELEINLKAHFIYSYLFMKRNTVKIIVRAKKNKENIIEHSIDLEYLMQIKYSGKIPFKYFGQKYDVYGHFQFDCLQNISIERGQAYINDSKVLVQEENYLEQDDSDQETVGDNIENESHSSAEDNSPYLPINSMNNLAISFQSKQKKDKSLAFRSKENSNVVSYKKFKEFKSDNMDISTSYDNIHICADTNIGDENFELLKIALSNSHVHQININNTMLSFMAELQQLIDSSQKLDARNFSSENPSLLSKHAIHIFICGAFNHIVDFLIKFIDCYRSSRLIFEKLLNFYAIILDNYGQTIHYAEKIFENPQLKKSSQAFMDILSRNPKLSPNDIKSEIVNFIQGCSFVVTLPIGNIVIRDFYSSEAKNLKFFVAIDIQPSDSSSSSDDDNKKEPVCDVLIEYWSPDDNSQNSSKSSPSKNLKNTLKKKSQSIRCTIDGNYCSQEPDVNFLNINIVHQLKSTGHNRLINFKRSTKKNRNTADQSLEYICCKAVFRPNKCDYFSAFIDGNEFTNIKYMLVTPTVLQRVKNIQLHCFN